jgi:hypothetical protein
MGSRKQRAVQWGTDRGDVPGWVLVAVMTAGLVSTLWVLADDQLGQVLEHAIQTVSGR